MPIGQVQDDNKGYISEPSVVHKGRVATRRTKTPSQMDVAVQKVGSSLGAAFGQYAKKSADNIRQQQKLRGAARAGMATSMDDIDEDVQKTSWTDGIFGEDVEMQELQRTVITNGIEATMRTQLSEIDQRADMTEREYGQMLTSQLNESLKPYEGDQATQDRIAESFAIGAKTLVNKHHKEHYAYKQVQMREQERVKTLGRVDNMTLLGETVRTPAEVKQLATGWASILNTDNRPLGMSKATKAAQLLENTNESLKSGNVALYKQMNKAGKFKGITLKEVTALETSISNYDTDFGRRVNVSLEETVADLEGIQSIEEATARVDALLSAIDTHEVRQTGSDHSKSIIAEARARAAKMIPKLMAAGASGRKKRNDINQIREIMRKDNVAEVAADITAHRFIPKQVKIAADENFVEDVLGDDPDGLGGQGAFMQLMSDPASQSKFVTAYRKGSHSSEIFTNALKAGINGGLSMQSGGEGDSAAGGMAMANQDNGLASEQYRSLMTMFTSLDRSNGSRLAKDIGEKDYLRGQLMAQYVSSNVPMDKAVEMSDAIVNNKDGNFGDVLHLPEKTTQRDYVAQKFKVGSNMQAANDVNKWFKQGLILHKGDERLATDYVKNIHQSKQVRSGNVIINNGAYFAAELGERDFGDVLDFIQQDKEIGQEFLRGIIGDQDAAAYDNSFVGDAKGALNFFLPKSLEVSTYVDPYEGMKPLEKMAAQKANAPHKFAQVPGLKMEMAADNEGVWVSAPNAGRRLLPARYFENIAGMMEDKRFAENQAVRREAAISAKEKAHQLEQSKAVFSSVKSTTSLR